MDLKAFGESKRLSRRETEVLEQVARGITNKEVANVLFVTEKTIKFHLTNIYRKCGWKSRSQAIVWCAKEAQPAVAAPIHTPEPEFSPGMLVPGRGGNA